MMMMMMRSIVITRTVDSSDHTCQPRKTRAVDDKRIVRALKTTVSDVTNSLRRVGVKVSRSTSGRPEWNLQMSTEMSPKSSGSMINL